jgi:20S proteasome alpha/beta subunit
MTVLAALECTDGILLASDREESDGDSKGAARKIFDSSSSSCRFAVLTAGFSPLCDLAVSRIEESAAGAQSAGRYVEIVSDVLRELYTEFVWPAEIPRAREREIELLLAVASNQGYRLFSTCDEIVQPRRQFVVAGSGAELAGYFLERLYEPSLTVSEAVRLLAFVCREAGDSASGVGLGTELLALTASGASRTLADDTSVPALSECITRFWKTKRGRRQPRAARGGEAPKFSWVSDLTTTPRTFRLRQ